MPCSTLECSTSLSKSRSINDSCNITSLIKTKNLDSSREGSPVSIANYTGLGHNPLSSCPPKTKFRCFLHRKSKVKLTWQGLHLKAYSWWCAATCCDISEANISPGYGHPRHLLITGSGCKFGAVGMCQDIIILCCHKFWKHNKKICCWYHK